MLDNNSTFLSLSFLTTPLPFVSNYLTLNFPTGSNYTEFTLLPDVIKVS